MRKPLNLPLGPCAHPPQARLFTPDLLPEIVFSMASGVLGDHPAPRAILWAVDDAQRRGAWRPGTPVGTGGFSDQCLGEELSGSICF